VLATSEVSSRIRQVLEQDLERRFQVLVRDSRVPGAGRRTVAASSSPPRSEGAAAGLSADGTRDVEKVEKARAGRRKVAPVPPAPEPSEDSVKIGGAREARARGEEPARGLAEEPAEPGHAVPAREEITLQVALQDIPALREYLADWARSRGGALQPQVAMPRRQPEATAAPPGSNDAGAELQATSPDARPGGAPGEEAIREERPDAPDTAENSLEASGSVRVRIVFERLPDRSE
jgi:hypothetical protein